MDPGLGDLKVCFFCVGSTVACVLLFVSSSLLLLLLSLFLSLVVSKECNVGRTDFDLPFCRLFLHREIMSSIVVAFVAVVAVVMVKIC